jgi:hypothetical protein
MPPASACPEPSPVATPEALPYPIQRRLSRPRRKSRSGTPRQEFGLDQPRCTVVLSDGGRILFEATFGAYDPQDLLPYMQLKNRDNLYLMSRFDTY